VARIKYFRKLGCYCVPNSQTQPRHLYPDKKARQCAGISMSSRLDLVPQ